MAFTQDKAPRLAAALAYYAFSAIAPLLFLVTVVAGYFLGRDQVRAQLLQGLRDNLGDAIATLISGLLPKLNSDSLTWAGVIGAFTVFLTGTGLFVQLQGSLNALWGADPPVGKPPTLLQNIWNLIKTRLIAFGLVLLFGALIIAFLVGNAYLSAVAESIGDLIGFGAFFVRAGTFVLSVLLFTPVFAFIYKFLPSVRLEWREVWVGAGITAALFTLGQVLIGLYFGRFAGSSPYGAAAALFLMLLWIYYSSMIVFFGAEVTWVFSQRYGTQAGGAGNPEKKEAVAEQGAAIDTGVSASEAEAIAATRSEDMTPAQRRTLETLGHKPAGQKSGRRSGVSRFIPARFRRPAQPTPEAEQPQDDLPTVRAAISNATIAVLAVPSVAVLRVVRVFRRR